MAKKNRSSGRKSQPSKRKSSKGLAAVLVILAVLAIGVVTMRTGGDVETPPAKMADGRVVVLEFFDYG